MIEITREEMIQNWDNPDWSATWSKAIDQMATLVKPVLEIGKDTYRLIDHRYDPVANQQCYMCWTNGDIAVVDLAECLLINNHPIKNARIIPTR